MSIQPNHSNAVSQTGLGTGPQSPAVSPFADAVSSTPRLSGRIMIVDDEIANVMITRKLLERAGYSEFETTTDSTIALSLAQSANPDVLLLDINMPKVDGVEILKRIRRIEKFQHLPVLILTANSEADIKLKCLELGATDFLVKPVDPMELAPRVRNALKMKSYQDRLQNHAAELEQKVRQRTRELELSRREVIYCLARAAELRDNDTGNHVIRVGRYAGIVAKNLGLPDNFVADIELAAQLHDVGKIDNDLYQRLVENKGEYEGADPEDADEYLANNIFFVPKKPVGSTCKTAPNSPKSANGLMMLWMPSSASTRRSRACFPRFTPTRN